MSYIPSAKYKVKWQKKTLAANFAPTGIITDLSFNNLEIGKTYRLGGQIAVNGDNGSINIKDSKMTLYNGATELLELNAASGDTGSYNSTIGINLVFTATATTVTFDRTVDGISYINSANGSTFATIEELPDTSYKVTTDWT